MLQGRHGNQERKGEKKPVAAKHLRIKSHVPQGEVALAIVNKKIPRKLIFTCWEPQHTPLKNDGVAHSLMLSMSAPITFYYYLFINQITKSPLDHLIITKKKSIWKYQHAPKAKPMTF
jgi:hypothetical protein